MALRGEFVAYYLILIVVNQVTFAQTNWTVGDLIRDGSMNILLLRPLPPVLDAVATELAGKGVFLLFVGPVTLGLSLLLKPELEWTMIGVMAFIPALILAWLLRFLWGYALALLAFWAARADALLALTDAAIFLLAGQVAPISLLPDLLRTFAVLLPFRYMLSFPVEVLMNRLDSTGLVLGFAMQGFWLVVALFASVALWHRGVRRYAAVGG
ncbi:MAG: ABC-2 family transporter protein [Anaerolineales bacterium]|nr:ABC-2 family transporter protein [Anaerolineales bacterium]